jgi:PAS domain S-box-containing protein
MKQLMAMLERAADAAMVVDERGTIIYWNRAAERLLGFRTRDVVGRPCHEVLCGMTPSGQPLCSPTCAIGAQLARGGAVRHFDMQTRTKAGRSVWINVSSFPVPTRKRTRFLRAHLFRDITALAKVRRLVNELHMVVSAPVEQARHELNPAHASSQSDPVPISPALPLSEREREVLRHLAAGHATRQIADVLCISTATVRNHIQHILAKLGAHTRLEALAIAYHPGSPPA